MLIPGRFFFLFVIFIYIFIYLLTLVTTKQLWDLLSHHRHPHCSLFGEIIKKQPYVEGVVLAKEIAHPSGEGCHVLGFLSIIYGSILLFPLQYPQHGSNNLSFHNTVQNMPFPSFPERVVLCPSTWPPATRESFIFYQQLIAIIAALWPDKGLHLYGSVIVSCSLVGLSDHLPAPLFTEVLAETNFPACNWVRQWLNHVG